MQGFTKSLVSLEQFTKEFAQFEECGCNDDPHQDKATVLTRIALQRRESQSFLIWTSTASSSQIEWSFSRQSLIT